MDMWPPLLTPAVCPLYRVSFDESRSRRMKVFISWNTSLCPLTRSTEKDQVVRLDAFAGETLALLYASVKAQREKCSGASTVSEPA